MNFKNNLPYVYLLLTQAITMCFTAKICRLCLSNERRAHSVSNTVLQHVWERLTNATFDNNDGRPLVICYICCALLKNCHELMQRALKAEKLFKKFTINNLEESKEVVSLVVSKAYEIDYNYAIENQYNFGLKHGESNILEVEEIHHINIKEEVKDEFSDETVTVIDIEKDKNANEEKEGASKKTRKLNEVPKVIKLNQIVNNNENLPKTTYKIPLNNFTSSDVQWSKNVLADRNVKIQVKDNTPKDDNLNEDIKYKDVILQNKNAPTQVISYVHAENENSEQIFPKRVSAIAPCTSLDSNDERKQSNIRNKTRSESSLLCQDKRTKKGIKDKHLRKRTADNSFICDLCDQKFSQKQGLKMHILYKHTEKNFSCHICRHKFVTKNKLDRHLQRYTGGKPYVCELCDYRATEKYEVSRHVQHRHGKEKSFPFQQRGNLNQDLSSQIVKKLFKCYLCDHRSSGKDLLSSHLLHKHSKDNNLPNKTYQYSLDINPLNRHLHKPNDKKGEEKKRYRCVLCYFRGSDISSVIVHMKEKHPK